MENNRMGSPWSMLERKGMVLRGGDGRTGRGASGAGSEEALRKHLALVVRLWGAAVWMVVTERGGGRRRTGGGLEIL